MTFKEFMATTADHVQPKEAEVMYKEYMINELGDAKKVWFTEHHDSEELRSKYDPVRLEEALKRREGEAKASVSEFLEGRTAGMDFSVPDSSTAPAGAPSERVKIPKEAWSSEREEKDAAILYKLISKVDQEKNIQKNPLFGGSDAMQHGDDNKPKAEMLDKLLSYAWKVHGIDYYAGVELSLNDFGKRKGGDYSRRGPKPEGDDIATGSDDMDTGDASDFFKNLEMKWELRVIEGDQVYKLLGKEEIDNEAENFVKENIQCIDGSKFMCKLCTKLFKGEDYTRKHILNKHGEVIEQVKCKTIEKRYKENFLSDETFKEHEKEYKELMAMRTLAAAPTLVSDGRGNFVPLQQQVAVKPQRKYTDLDRPKQETRTVLDYGDI